VRALTEALCPSQGITYRRVGREQVSAKNCHDWKTSRMGPEKSYCA